MRYGLAIALTICLGPQPAARQPPASSSASAGWAQWGGPTRNFVVDSRGLASKWPANGPKRIWSRTLGEGHSSIAVDGNRLYTMYRPLATGGRSQQEAVVALDANSGATIWEHKYSSPTAGVDFTEGAGPHATPLVTADRVYATGSRKELFALDKSTGKMIWSHDLIKQYGADGPGRGYACSPLLFNNMLIVTVGSGQALAAFDPKTGALIWKGGKFDFSPSSPIVADVDGQKQLIFFAGDVIAGVNPADGQTLWTHPHKTSWGLNISTPVWFPAEHLLFVSSAYNTGTRVLELHQTGGKTSVAEKWFSNRMRVHIGTLIRVGNQVIGSSGDFGPAFLTAVDLTTGKIAWQDRSFARAQLLQADGRLIILDEDGDLGIATATPQGLQILSRASILQNRAWTPPTLVGTRLYLRDRKTVTALDLGSQP